MYAIYVFLSFFGENFVGITAALGAFAVSIGVLILSNSGGRSNSMKLLLAGMALSAVCSAFSSFIVYFSNDKEGMQSITYWLMGSLAAAKWDNLAIIFPITILGIGFFISQSRILNLMLLGDEAAITLGTDLHRYRHVYLLISAIMIGFIVYSSGVIGFGNMMMEIAGLSFLGLGAEPPLAEWGLMVSQGRSFMQTAPWVVIAPGLAIFITVLVFNMLGDTLSDITGRQ